jgi:cyclopropane fatty-acyl-phospholipid synthase-like methyltransferase
MTDYIYNADDNAMDEWAMNFNNRLGDGSGDHEEAYLDMLKLLINLNRSGAMIDIGCGLGRVTEIADGRIAEIAALEPDLVRYKDCHKRFHSPPICTVLNQMSYQYISDNPGKLFDLVVLGMVIQHISTDACTHLIEDAAKLVKPDGAVIISTTLAPEDLKGFSYSNEPENSYLSRTEFNNYANNPQTQNKGIPVRRFSEKELKTEVNKHFEVLQWTQFSYYRSSRLEWFCQTLNTLPEILENTGNSQFVVLRKRQNRK